MPVIYSIAERVIWVIIYLNKGPADDNHKEYKLQLIHNAKRLVAADQKQRKSPILSSSQPLSSTFEWFEA